MKNIFWGYGHLNHIYNKILDSDWFSARLFVTKSARDHVGVQLQLSDLSNWIPVIGCPHDFHINYARFNGFLSSVFYSLQNLGKALLTLTLKRSS